MSSHVAPPRLPQVLLDAGLTGAIEYELLVKLSVELGITPPELLDRLGLQVAQDYHSGAMTYDDGDVIMNAAFAIATTAEFFAAYDDTVPADMFEVFYAFDQGEWIREGDYAPPDVLYTKPRIEALLRRKAPGMPDGGTS